jgi:hypothetical protein
MATTKPPIKKEQEAVNPDSIRAIFGLKPHQSPYQASKATPIHVSDPTLLYGVELEIEYASPDWTVPGMSAVPDNSLRNSGLEYLTNPSTLSVLNYTLERFFSGWIASDRNYSERCSVHVHANCHDLTLDQLAVVVMLYQTFERLLYRFVGAERDRNIFCVPWHETQLTWAMINDFKDNAKGYQKIRHWQKYTGLNLVPLSNYGTIEFRQMPGTPDRKKIIEWCNLIGCLFSYARTNDLESTKKYVLELNTNSEYKGMLERVFREWADLIRVPLYEQALEEGVLNTKYSLMERPPAPTLRASPPDAPSFQIDWSEVDARPILAENTEAELTSLQARILGRQRQGNEQQRQRRIPPTFLYGASTTTPNPAVITRTDPRADSFYIDEDREEN